jgi:pyridoxine kinase
VNILSIQSRVAYGHVGNAAAVFPLQRLGHEVWPVDTVSVSNHLGYPTWRGRFRAPDELGELIEGLDSLGVLARCDVVLSGYLGQAGNGAVVAEAVRRVRAANPRALYACDPVMGDRRSGLFVKPDIPPVFEGLLLPLADIAFPNAFELAQITGGGTGTLIDALAAADRLRAAMRSTLPQGPLVLVKSLDRTDGPAGDVEVLAVEDTGAWLAAAPRHEVPANGAGDCFAALFLGHYLRGRDAAGALGRAVSAIDAVLAKTAAAGSPELALIAAQDELDPREPKFRAERVETVQKGS